VVSLVVTTGLFALLFRFLPDESTVASSYGAAGSMMILLLWVYYSCQILLFGAEFTRVYVQRHGAKAKPESFAVKDPHAVNPKSALAPVSKS
jgi:membrane protein